MQECAWVEVFWAAAPPPQSPRPPPCIPGTICPLQGTIRLLNYWGVGKSEHNSGVLLVFSMQDRRMRIAVADGLTSVLPDDLCQQIINDTFVPPRNTPPFGAPLLRGKR